MNNKNNKFLIDQAKKSNNKGILFQFLLTQAQEYNRERINFTSDDYERFRTALKVSSDFSEEDDRECDNEFTIFMSYFDAAFTKFSCKNVPTYM